uniref:Peptidase A2 domain-containing protein n=1 Tax=Nymphaea colorata TaxID=210225 RepID=A0A5K0XJV1_9MAGN
MVWLNEVLIHALMDTGATHNFVASHLVEHFGLIVMSNASHVKAINVVRSATNGEAEAVRT